MLNLTPHRRLKIPHGLAIFAAILLIGSSVAGTSPNQGALASVNENEITIATKNMENDIHVIDESVIRDTVKHNSHVLKLGLQLFQR